MYGTSNRVYRVSFPKGKNRRIRVPKCGLQTNCIQNWDFFSLFFSTFFLGLTAIFFLSQVCPTNLSLQFDTTMMYVICILCYVKLYQFRHPDATASAYSTLFVLGVLVLIEALALYSSSWIVYGLFLVCYVGMTIFIAFDAYYLGIGKWYF